jgi:hypothetical protein
MGPSTFAGGSGNGGAGNGGFGGGGGAAGANGGGGGGYSGGGGGSDYPVAGGFDVDGGGGGGSYLDSSATDPIETADTNSGNGYVTIDLVSASSGPGSSVPLPAGFATGLLSLTALLGWFGWPKRKNVVAAK